MEERKPLIFISNDDGVTAKGINELIKYLRPLGEVVVMAPDSARSGSGCALTVNTPVHYKLIKREPGLTIYSCSGTPVDCVKLARNTILDRTPDLIVGGINHGDNSGTNVHYSGTMGIVIEGCLNGIPSVGFSLCNHAPDADFAPFKPYVVEVARMVLEKGLPDRTCLNVNFPDTQEVKGVKVCEQAVGRWQKEWEPCPRRFDDCYYWLTGEFVNTEPENPKTDNWALAQGYVAITPTTVDVTAYGFIEELTNRLSIQK
ncbi:5'/3'-nucleotidase SurE [Bacteroides sp. 224]|uniref:5'/3'-nucleotidase SurE n=1 Tax=Bacteroides sp. 224 TaxID=2302936 RepID=UPI0013D81757|nr:5'/3'-nucleotidase SurE [Bacteroides sp. 224]NDV65547.1 5'/3'-nucleotidase SurE [Bacteroides sp. 224]